MTKEEAIAILDCMETDMTEASGGVGKFNPLADVVKQRLDAIRFCRDILRAQVDAERNEPLTLKELLGMKGKPVFICKDYNGGSTWCVVAFTMENSIHFTDGTACPLRYYGDVWLAYRREPEEVERWRN